MYDLLGCDIVTPYYLVGGYRLLGQLAVIICPEDSSCRCLHKTSNHIPYATVVNQTAADHFICHSNISDLMFSLL